MISKIFIDGVRSIAGFETEFGPGITVVHGPWTWMSAASANVAAEEIASGIINLRISVSNMI